MYTIKEYRLARKEFLQLKDNGTLEYLYNGQSILAYKPGKLEDSERLELANINYLIDIRTTKKALLDAIITIKKYNGELSENSNMECTNLFDIIEKLEQKKN